MTTKRDLWLICRSYGATTTTSRCIFPYKPSLLLRCRWCLCTRRVCARVDGWPFLLLVILRWDFGGSSCTVRSFVRPTGDILLINLATNCWNIVVFLPRQPRILSQRCWLFALAQQTTSLVQYLSFTCQDIRNIITTSGFLAKAPSPSQRILLLHNSHSEQNRNSDGPPRNKVWSERIRSASLYAPWLRGWWWLWAKEVISILPRTTFESFYN